MQHVPLTQALHENQGYVRAHANERFRAVLHDTPTSSCEEKASLLGWPAHRVVKALYYSNKDSLVGIVLPHTDKKIRSRHVIARATGLSRTKAARFTNGQVPLGMEHGTCTPFAREDADIDYFVIHKDPSLDEQLVDVSVGGVGERWHRTSLHLPYKAIHTILSKAYASRVTSFNVFDA